MKPRTLGVEEIEKQEKEEQKQKAVEKKAAEKKAPKTEDVAEEAPVVKKSKKKESAPVVKKVKGAKYLKAKKMVDVKKAYTLPEAVALLKKMKYVSFDESVELHLNVDKTGLKGELDLPHSTGKMVKVAIVDDKVLNDLENGRIEFDILITHPSFMPKLAKYAKVLGPKGLMPNPKAGTISPNPEQVAKKFLKGMLRWKTEAKFPLIHQMIGKLSFDDAKLVENAKVFIEAVGRVHILQGYMTGTMTPAVRLDLEKL